MIRALPVAVVLMFAAIAAAAQAPRDSLIERAKALEGDTPYVPPPGDVQEHHASGHTKVMCSAVLITGLDPDWARLGNLYLQDGVWNGKRILPEGYAKFVSSVAPAWQADGRPIYGGFFWLNTEGAFSVPRDAYYMAGLGTQIAMIILSHDLVVVRMGHYRDGSPGFQSLNEALAVLIEAVPAKK
jgi:CubicO group peptidase (beta-lactamase class C family)